MTFKPVHNVSLSPIKNILKKNFALEQKVPLKIFLSDPYSPLGHILELTLRTKAYEMISRIDIESNVIIHNSEEAESNLNQKNENAFTRNYENTKSICTAIDKWEVKPSAFIYLSSVSVYGSKGGELITENHPLNGSTAYAKSKIMAEDFLIEWAYKTKVTLCILRLPAIIMSEKSPGSLVEMIEAIRLGNYIGIGSGRCRKSTLWAADIVTLIPKIPAIEGIYNLTDSYHPSYKELEVMITKLLGKKSPVRMPYLVAKLIAWLGDIFGNIIPLNSKKLNTINSTLTFDDQKARKTFDWKPSNAIERWTESMIETKTYKS